LSIFNKVPLTLCGLLCLSMALQAETMRLKVEPIPASSRRTLKDHEPRAHILADPDWFTWGCSVIQGNDGKYHMFYARWPKKHRLTAWLTHSEIAHAVASRPEGPYRYLETAIQARGEGHWDEVTAHNPKIKFFEGKYYLYYISTRGETGEKEKAEIAQIGYGHSKWRKLRENQRTGVAVADSLNGPWERLKKPIVEPAGVITTLTVNPAVCRGPDGTYFMIVKGDKPNEKRFIRNQALATAKAPIGPFTIQPKPVIDYLDTEDVSMWFDTSRERFFAVFHAHRFIGLITSKNGFTWEKAEPFELMAKGIRFDDGTKWLPQRMERPFLLTDEKGRPRFLYVACKKENESVNICMAVRALNEPSTESEGSSD
jgi:hypothetical protein